jgi:hypothetical protein
MKPERMNDYFFLIHESYNADADSCGRGLHNIHDLIQQDALKEHP